MLTKQENELLTRVGPGTPAGELLRRYWQPAGLFEELEAAAPVPVRLLGEDLVLFRNERGQPGLTAMERRATVATRSEARRESNGNCEDRGP